MVLWHGSYDIKMLHKENVSYAVQNLYVPSAEILKKWQQTTAGLSRTKLKTETHSSLHYKIDI
jgi:hypothetical protein